jgi:hypothetical protein
MILIVVIMCHNYDICYKTGRLIKILFYVMVSLLIVIIRLFIILLQITTRLMAMMLNIEYRLMSSSVVDMQVIWFSRCLKIYFSAW